MKRKPSSILVHLATILSCFCLLTGCGLLRERLEQKEAPEELFETEPIAYDVSVQSGGSEEEQASICDAFKKHSQLVLLKDDLPDGILGLSRRAHGDKQAAVKLLRSLGYYDGMADIDVAEPEDKEKNASVSVKLAPGPQYRIGTIGVSYEPALHELPQQMAKDVEPIPETLRGIKAGDPAVADNVLAAVDATVAILQRAGYPEAKVASSKYLLDREKKHLNVVVVYDPGPAALMGEAIVQGTEKVDPAYVAKLVTWDDKQLWDDKVLTKYRERLQHLGLFRSVDVKPCRSSTVTSRDGDGLVRLPVQVDVKETSFRTVSASARYATDTGIGLLGEWEHRNVFGAGEKVDVKVPFAQDKRGMQIDFEKPCFGHPDQKFLAGTSFLREDTDAYTQSALNAYVGMERKLSEYWWTSLKLFGEKGYVTRDEKNDYHYGSVIWSIKRDTRDDLLNPTKGTLIQLDIAPTAGYYRGDFFGVSTKATAAAYYAPFSDDFLVLAGRIGAGSFIGADLKNIPPSLRFYCGGGGSVRGYAYQSIGPHDKHDDPVGGRSFQEVNLEARFRVTKDIGIVPFIDGGTVYKGEFGNIGEDFRWAAGIGLRYYTAIGPIRLDVAMPLNKQKRDKGYQFYISIGQAF